jgi:hypothetical protein
MRTGITVIHPQGGSILLKKLKNTAKILAKACRRQIASEDAFFMRRSRKLLSKSKWSTVSDGVKLIYEAREACHDGRRTVEASERTDRCARSPGAAGEAKGGAARAEPIKALTPSAYLLRAFWCDVRYSR